MPHSVIFSSAIASKNSNVRFGKEEIPPPPEHVPAKFKKAWETLPPCCRNFYLNPGKGCCAGMSEPNAKIMETSPIEPVCKGDSCTIDKTSKASPKTQSTQPQKSWLRSVIDWFKHLFTGFWKDLKRIFTASKSD